MSTSVESARVDHPRPCFSRFRGPCVAAALVCCLAGLWVASGGEIGVPVEGRGVYTPLHAAARAGDAAAVRRLAAGRPQRHTYRPGCRDGTGCTPLHYAASAGHLEVVRVLIARGADPCATDDFGCTPLHCAAASYSGHNSAVAEELLRYCRSIDQPDGDGRTPLHLASMRGDADLVGRLIAAGAGIGVRDGDGRTALHLAAVLDRPAVVEVLLRAGADPSARDGDGLTPAALAASYRCGRAAAALRLLAAKSSHQPGMSAARDHT